jgi:hypothetical protein
MRRGRIKNLGNPRVSMLQEKKKEAQANADKLTVYYGAVYSTLLLCFIYVLYDTKKNQIPQNHALFSFHPL